MGINRLFSNIVKAPLKARMVNAILRTGYGFDPAGRPEGGGGANQENE